jgi:hypothetical protein
MNIIKRIRKFLFAAQVIDHYLTKTERINKLEQRVMVLERDVDFLRSVRVEPMAKEYPIVEPPKKARRKRRTTKTTK